MTIREIFEASYRKELDTDTVKLMNPFMRNGHSYVYLRVQKAWLAFADKMMGDDFMLTQRVWLAAGGDGGLYAVPEDVYEEIRSAVPHKRKALIQAERDQLENIENLEIQCGIRMFDIDYHMLGHAFRADVHTCEVTGTSVKALNEEQARRFFLDRNPKATIWSIQEV